MKFTKICETYDITLLEQTEPRRIKGQCFCGTIGIFAYDSIRKQKFCRNPLCTYYCASKKFDHEEMKLILEERACQVTSIQGPGLKAQVSFTCVCGFQQTNMWKTLYTKDATKWCKYNKCAHYKKTKEYEKDVLVQWFTMEGYTPKQPFAYTSFVDYFILICPAGHDINMNMNMWTSNSRCVICKGNKKRFSFEQLQQKYRDHRLEPLFTLNDFLTKTRRTVLPYKCEDGHVSSHLPYEDFMNRIRQGLNPCVACSTDTSYEIRRKAIQNHLEQYHLQLVLFDRRHRIVQYDC